MPARGEQYDVKCLMCGIEVGHIVFGRFIKHADCAAALPRKGGLPRCCHCGGTLHLAPMEGYLPAVVHDWLDRMIAEEASARPSGRPQRRQGGRRGSGAA